MKKEAKGYIKLSRKSIQSDIWDKPPLFWKIWCYLLLKASHKDTNLLKKGELLVTISELQEVGSYYIGYRKITPTVKQIRVILDFLRNPDEGLTKDLRKDATNDIAKGAMIVTTKVTNATLINIVNYSTYQGIDDNESQYESYDESNSESQCEKYAKDLRKVSQGRNSNNKNDNKNDKNNINTKENIKEKLPFSNQNLGTTQMKPSDEVIIPEVIDLEPKKRFTKPTVEQVREYADSIDYHWLNPQAFIDFYESKGWKVGKTPMKDWKACVRTWKNNDKLKGRTGNRAF